MFCNIFIFSFNTLGIIVLMNFVIGMNLVIRNGINRNFIHDNINNINNIKVFVNKLNNNLINISWEVLKVFGKICIFSDNYVIKPFNKFISKPVIKIIHYLEPEKNRIIFVKDGKEILSYKKKSNISTNDVTEYDFILFHPLNESIMILNNINDIPDINEVDHSILETNVNFMCCQLSIKLNNDKLFTRTLVINDFFVNSNKILDNCFVKWYCNKHFSTEINLSDVKNYKINIIDNEINEIELSPNEFIVINKNSYNVNKNTIKEEEQKVQDKEEKDEEDDEEDDKEEEKNKEEQENKEENKEDEKAENKEDEKAENKEDENDKSNSNLWIWKQSPDEQEEKQSQEDENNKSNLNCWNWNIKSYLGFYDKSKESH